jgi:hypothetical protein
MGSLIFSSAMFVDGSGEATVRDRGASTIGGEGKLGMLVIPRAAGASRDSSIFWSKGCVGAARSGEVWLRISSSKD